MANSTASEIAPAEEPSRRINLEGAYNLRDLGGLPAAGGRSTRAGAMLRSDSLHALPEDSQTALLERGLRTLIDLRHPNELAARPNVFADSPHVSYINVSLLNAAPASAGGAPRPTDLPTINRLWLDEAQAAIAEVLRAIASSEQPVLVQCHAGKDRTGLIVALTLSAVGVDRETIAADYALSAEYLGREWLTSARSLVVQSGVPIEQAEKMLISPPEFMLGALAYVDEKYGGIDAYLQHIGITDEERQALREGLLEAQIEEAMAVEEALAEAEEEEEDEGEEDEEEQGAESDEVSADKPAGATAQQE
jgi:protein-tyrosine phosphatase